jgi:hypothetical protein
MTRRAGNSPRQPASWPLGNAPVCPWISPARRETSRHDGDNRKRGAAAGCLAGHRPQFPKLTSRPHDRLRPAGTKQACLAGPTFNHIPGFKACLKPGPASAAQQSSAGVPACRIAALPACRTRRSRGRGRPRARDVAASSAVFGPQFDHTPGFTHSLVWLVGGRRGSYDAGAFLRSAPCSKSQAPVPLLLATV